MTLGQRKIKVRKTCIETVFRDNKIGMKLEAPYYVTAFLNHADGNSSAKDSSVTKSINGTITIQKTHKKNVTIVFVGACGKFLVRSVNDRTHGPDLLLDSLAGQV